VLGPAACVRDASHVEVVDCHVEVEALRRERGLVSRLASLRDIIVASELEINVLLLLSFGIIRPKGVVRLADLESLVLDLL